MPALSPIFPSQVNGAWNNHEGVDVKFSKRYTDYLEAAGYATNVQGKTDYVAGGHSISARMVSWTNKVNPTGTGKWGRNPTHTFVINEMGPHLREIP